MAASALQAKQSKRKWTVPSRRTGREVPCEECGTLHYRAANKLRRRVSKNKSATGGLWLCSKACFDAVNKRAMRREPCLQCGKITTRWRSTIKQKVFCSKECANTYGIGSIQCSWPGCEAQTPCRTSRKRMRGKKVRVYKVKLVTKGRYNRHAFCAEHRAVIAGYVGEGVRWTSGRSKMLTNPEHEYDSRSTSSRFTRMLVFERCGRRCLGCKTAQDWNAPRDTWHVDHIVPVFKGGRTKLTNLQILCRACHDKKTAGEKSEVATLMWGGRKRGTRDMTHYEKDRLIDELRARITALEGEQDASVSTARRRRQPSLLA